jgi:hypothetical protein
VAEQPELHLRPHVEAWRQREGRLAVIGDHTDDADAYVLDLESRGANGSMGEARAAVFSLIGAFAESATYVRRRRVNREGPMMKLRFEVGTGEWLLTPSSRLAATWSSLTWPWCSNQHVDDGEGRLRPLRANSAFKRQRTRPWRDGSTRDESSCWSPQHVFPLPVL